MDTLTIYTLASCDTCRKAKAWLARNGLSFEEKAIRQQPPTVDELRAMVAAQEVRRVFNTAGREYRALGLADVLPTLSDDAAIALLARNGSLIKRPFLIGAGVALVGFDEPAWAQALAGRGR